MKSLKIFSLVLSITCAFAQTTIFTPTDEALAQLYPGTLKGFELVDASVISSARAVKADWSLASPEDVKAFRSYYFGKFLNFMTGLRQKNPKETADKEFNALFDNIYNEAHEAACSEIGELKWLLVQVMFIRGLLLASGEGTPEAYDLLSNVPDTDLFFGALRETPAYLRTPGEPVLPAWKHSVKACLHNMSLDDTKGNDVHEPSLQTNFLSRDIVDQIKKTAKQFGLHKNVYLPMLDCGKVGITTIMKMWLHHAFPVPLTYGEYEAHGIRLGAAVGAEHDEAHGKVDNRRREVQQAILNLLNKVLEANKPVKRAIPLATRHMVERYQAFNEVLLAFIEAKERTAIEQLRAAVSLAPGNKSDPSRKEAEMLARQRYNTGVAALFQVLHEEYAMSATVLEVPTLAEAITKICDNAKTRENIKNFDELETFFNPTSDLSDQEIFEKIKSRTLQSTGIYFLHNGSTPAPVTISDFVDHIDLESLRVIRGPVITEVKFDTNAGQTVKVQTATTRYLVDTIRDENAVLGLVGKKVPGVPLDMENLRVLPKDAPARIEVLSQVKTWFDTVVANTSEMVTNLLADVLANTPADVVARYDALVAAQNAEWQVAYPAPVVEATSAVSTVV